MDGKGIPISFSDIAKALQITLRHTTERGADGSYIHTFTPKYPVPKPTFEGYDTFTSEEDLKAEIIRRHFGSQQVLDSTIDKTMGYIRAALDEKA